MVSDGDRRGRLVERIEWGLAMPDACEHQMRLQEEAYDEVDRCRGLEV